MASNDMLKAIVLPGRVFWIHKVCLSGSFKNKLLFSQFLLSFLRSFLKSTFLALHACRSFTRSSSLIFNLFIFIFCFRIQLACLLASCSNLITFPRHLVQVTTMLKLSTLSLLVYAGWSGAQQADGSPAANACAMVSQSVQDFTTSAGMAILSSPLLFSCCYFINLCC